MIGRTSPQSAPDLLVVTVMRLLSSFSQLDTKAHKALATLGMEIKVCIPSCTPQLLELHHKTVQLCVKHLLSELNQNVDSNN